MKHSATAQDPWVAFLRAEVKALFIGPNGKPEPGWFIGRARNDTAYLQHRPPGQAATVVPLPYPWAAGSRADLFERVKRIRAAMLTDGLTLQGAAQAAEGQSSRHVEDWAGAIGAYHQHKLHHGRVAVSEATWESKYAPHLDRLQALLTGPRPPVDAVSLLEAICRQWAPGSRSRQISAQSVAGFLRFSVERLGHRTAWLPPASLRDVVGTRRDAKRIGYPLTDAEVLRLIEGTPDPRWRFALQLLAVYGLRPADLQHLTIRGGALWSTYSKASGGGVTRPRALQPLLVQDLDGEPVQWNLQARFAAGEKLPPLGAPGKAGDALNTYLKRRPIWRQLRREVAARGEELVPYSLRHGYVRRGQLRGIPPKVLSAALGHSLESHLRSYSSWSDGEAVAGYFDHPPAAGAATVDRLTTLV